MVDFHTRQLDNLVYWLRGRCGYMEGSSLESKIDWLAVAIQQLGGVNKAAPVLGVSKQTIYSWLKKGCGIAKFDRLVRLSDLSKVSLEELKYRIGPFSGSPVIPLDAIQRAR